MNENLKKLRKKLSGILPSLNEKQKRLLVGAEALSIGYGGIKILSTLTGLSCPTIRRGIAELEMGNKNTENNVRKTGGGRKKITEIKPDLEKVLEEILDETTRGDPESPLKWTCKSVRNISDLLEKDGYNVSHQTIASILHNLEFSLQGNKKTKEGNTHPDRDAQFKFINKSVKKFLKNKLPAISVDTKKKELVGNYKNVGKEWQKKGTPKEVNGHDFPDPKIPKAVPYGVYDIGDNTGWVNVGTSADTSEFAVGSIKYWWEKIGIQKYPNANKLLICSDSGGSNACRSRLWKRELQKFSNEKNIEISVRHFPPGTSKWNKIEHRLFSFISINWRGKPLVTYQTIINLISSTKTKKGLTVTSRLDTKKYQKGLKVSKDEFSNINITTEKFHGNWNYTIKPNGENS